MKKSLVVAAVAVVALSSSCKKIYTCYCESSAKSETVFTDSQGGTATKSNEIKTDKSEAYSAKMSSKQAAAACSNTEYTFKKQLDEMFVSYDDTKTSGLKVTYTKSVSCKVK